MSIITYWIGRHEVLYQLIIAVTILLSVHRNNKQLLQTSVEVFVFNQDFYDQVHEELNQKLSNTVKHFISNINQWMDSVHTKSWTWRAYVTHVFEYLLFTHFKLKRRRLPLQWLVIGVKSKIARKLFCLSHGTWLIT